MTNTPQPRRNRFNSVTVDEVHTNVSQEIIEITTDKLTLILTRYLDSLQKSREWQTPLSLLVTIVLVLSTTSFKKSFGLPAETWAAIFIFSGGVALLWLIKSVIKTHKAMTIEDILKTIKNQT